MENIFIIVGFIGLAFGVFSYWQSTKTSNFLNERQKEINRRVYELAILKELGDRIGYSLNIQQIIDVITGSLHQLIPYCAVSYMLIEPEKIVFKVHLETSVDRKFVDDIKSRMIGSLSALLDKNLSNSRIEEIVTGAILIEDIQNPVQSYFNIPVVIRGKMEGILTIAHTKAGLYKEEDMSILYRIMQQASNALSKLQEVVANEERKLNAMVQSITEGVVMTDTDYRVVVANKAARTALALDESKDVTIFDFIDHLDGKFDIRGKLEESVKLNKILEAPEVLLHDKFYQIFVSPVSIPSSVNGMDVIGGVVIFRDITHEKEVEKLKEDFTSMMVHELRSPLDGIKKRIEVLREEGIKADKKYQDELIKTVYDNSSHMLELVNDLLDAAKLESGKFDLRKEPSDIRMLVKDRVTFFEILAQDGNIELTQNLSQDIPDKINFDPMRIEQVLNNLLSNSIKFTGPGGKVKVEGFIHKSGQDIINEAKAGNVNWLLSEVPKNLKDIGDSLIITVTDSGIGISAKDIGQLFNKFKQFRATAVKKEKSGTGLGLVIAKGIVEAHLGIISVASTESVGTTFYFTIPIN